MNKMIYLDNAATSRVFFEVREVVDRFLYDDFYNPSALYGASLVVKNELEQAREGIARLLCCDKDEVFFTGSATESNNWVLNCGRKYKKGNVVTTLGEHPSVFETANELKSRGVDVRFASLSSDGSVDLEDLFGKIDHETALVSVIHASNETGSVNDLKKIVEFVRKKAPRALIHADGVQAFCKISISMRELGLDFYSVSAHKVGGLKGVGALYINKRLSTAPFIFGGGQERGQRSGTENTAGIISFAKAAAIYAQKSATADVIKLRDHFISKLAQLPNCVINGTSNLHTGYVLSASIKGIKGEILQHMLSDKGILIGLGSACSAKSKQNRVLAAIGRSGKEIEGSIRISFCPDNTLDEISYAATALIEAIEDLRKKIGGKA